MTALLEVSGLTCRFGGVLAVNNVSFIVQEGEVYSVIGPNGAGKTTLFNLLSGIYLPTAGTITLRGEPIGGMRPEALARRHVSRTFQNLQLCMNMDAVQNVMIGAHLRLDTGLLSGILKLGRVRSADRQCRKETESWMAFAGVDRYIGSAADQMPYGALKRLEIARALMSQPQLLLLDEPAAGLNAVETREIEELVRRVAKTGVTVLLIEHDMKLVMSISDHILVMHHGSYLFNGTPAQVRQHPDVIAAYLGTDVEEDP